MTYYKCAPCDLSLMTWQPVQLVDPNLVATFHNAYTEADLWATTELVNTSPEQVTVVVKLDVSLDDADDFYIVDHVHTSEDIVIEGNSTISYSVPPVIFSIEWLHFLQYFQLHLEVKYFLFAIFLFALVLIYLFIHDSFHSKIQRYGGLMAWAISRCTKWTSP